MKFWINTVSRDHVFAGKEGGFIQAGHGRKAPLQRMDQGDMVVFYSPRTSLNNGEKLQQFTAIAEIIGREIYRVSVSESFTPWRRDARYPECREIPIQELLPELNFIKNRKSWGSYFRTGFFEIQADDFYCIARRMKKDI